MEKQTRILIVDDDEDILIAARLLLKKHFDQVVTCNLPEHIPVVMGDGAFDAILLDMNFSHGDNSGRDGFKWLKTILDKDPDAVVIMITAYGGVDVAVEAMKHGATDFIAKPWQNEKLVATLSAAVKLHDSRSETTRLKRSNKVLVEHSNASSQDLLGDSVAMRQVLSVISRAAPTDANVLVTGENGTGKELVARAIHQQSLRNRSVFMSVDLGAISENLFESELFGHQKGAFTGADQDRTGKLVAADGGTLFLDEIGNLPLHLQAKLLTVLEQRQVTPVGSNKSQPIDIRVIAATNLPQNELQNEQRFRQDLLFRLNTVEIKLPPLRARAEDIPLLAQHYLQQYSHKYRKPDKSLSPEALAAAKSYSWPGNVRALRHAIERAVILSEGQQIEIKDLQIEQATASTTFPNSVFNATVSNETEEPIDDLHLERMEKRLVETALKKHRYNISRAASELGLTRAALYRRMEKYGF